MPIPSRPTLASPHTAKDVEAWRRKVFPSHLELWSGDECITLKLDAGGNGHAEYGMVSYELGVEADRTGLTAVAERVFDCGVLRFPDAPQMDLAEPRVVYGEYAPDYVAVVEDKRYQRQQDGIKKLLADLAAKRSRGESAGS